MKQKGNFGRFIHSPSAANTMFSMDPVTEDVLTRCESCNAEARHTKYDLEDGFSFRHNDGCAPGGSWPDPGMMNKSRIDRAYDMAERLGSILEQELDPSLAVSTLSLLSAVACEAAAVEAGLSLTQLAYRFVNDFERAWKMLADTPPLVQENGRWGMPPGQTESTNQ